MLEISIFLQQHLIYVYLITRTPSFLICLKYLILIIGFGCTSLITQSSVGANHPRHEFTVNIWLASYRPLKLSGDNGWVLLEIYHNCISSSILTYEPANMKFLYIAPKHGLSFHIKYIEFIWSFLIFSFWWERCWNVTQK